MNKTRIPAPFNVLKTGRLSVIGWIPVCLFLAATPSEAATYDWDGNGVTKNVATASSWQGNELPPDYSDVSFGGTAGEVLFSNGKVFKVGDFAVTSNGYLFSTPNATANYTIELNSFSGSGLSSSTIGTAIDSDAQNSVTLLTNGNTAFTGTIKYLGPNVNGRTALIKIGTGTLDLRSATLQQNETFIQGGILQLSSTNLPSTMIRFGNAAGSAPGGLIEIVGNNVNPSEFTAAINNVSTANSIALGGGSTNQLVDLAGFGAVDGNLILAFGGIASPSLITWSTAGTGVGFKPLVFQMGTATSTHMVFLRNGIDLRLDRTIRVGNGAAAIDADIEGAITMTLNTPADRILTKDGTGTLRLSGNNAAATGRLRIAEGKVLVDGTWASATNNATYGISVASGATLGGDGTITLSNNAAKLIVDGTLAAGRGGADQSLTLNANLEMNEGSILEFTIGGASDSDILQRTGGSWTFQLNQSVKITSLGFTGEEYTLITGLDASFATTYNLSLWQLAPGSNVDGSFRLDGNTLMFDAIVQPIPEPSSLLLLGVASGAILVAWRRKRSASRGS